MANLGLYGLPLPPARGPMNASRLSHLRQVMADARRLASTRRVARPRRVRPTGWQFARLPVVPPHRRPAAPQPPAVPPVRRFAPAVGPEQAPAQYRPGPGFGIGAWTSDPREIMALIAEYARRNLVVVVRYDSIKDGQVVTRAIEPYSIRVRWSNRQGGRTRYLYGYDVNGPTVRIHSLLVNRLRSVQGTTQRFSPRWLVEF